MSRPNLRVVTNALAEKITFDGRRARGVVFRLDGEVRTAHAAAEIVLCGGREPTGRSAPTKRETERETVLNVVCPILEITG